MEQEDFFIACLPRAVGILRMVMSVAVGGGMRRRTGFVDDDCPRLVAVIVMMDAGKVAVSATLKRIVSPRRIVPPFPGPSTRGAPLVPVGFHRRHTGWA